MPPVIAVVAAIGTVSAGVAAVAAGSEIIGGLMIAGGVASGLGAITGNKTLSMIGGIASLGGGLAGLASGAWDTVSSSLADASTLNPEGAVGGMNAGGIDAGGFNPADIGSGGSGATSGLAVNGSDASGLVSPNMGDAAQGAVQASQGSMRDALGAGAPDVQTPTATDTSAGMQPNAPQPDASSVNNAQPSAQPGASPAGAPAAPPSTSSFQASNPADPNAANATNGSDLASDKYSAAHYTDQPTQTSGSASLWDTMKSLPKWVNDNKELAKAASGLIAAGMTSYGQQSLLKQKYALEDEYLQKQRQRYSNSIIGLNMPRYVPPTPSNTSGS